MKNKFQVVVPESYKHLLQLALKGQKLSCDQPRSHTSNLFHVMVVIKIVAASASFVCLVLSLFSKWQGLSLGLMSGLLGIIAFGSALYHVRLYRRSWMKAHQDKVVMDLIPTHLRTQIDHTCTALVGNGSRLELVRRGILKVIIKGQDTQNFIKQFRATKGKDGDLPSYLVGMQKQAEGYLLFGEVDKLLKKSERLLKVDFVAKLEEVAMFNRSLNASMQEKPNFAFAREVCLAQVRGWCQSLNELSVKFNYLFDESLVSYISSDIMISKDMEKTASNAKYRAEKLLEKLADFYGVKPDEPKEEEPAKPDENKAGEPTTGGVHLTEEDLKELEDLDLSSLDK